MAGRHVFSLLLFVLLAGSHAAFGASVVKETCAKATAGGRHEDLAPFCVATLQAAPGSAGADARGLAVIATNLTLVNYTEALVTIKKLLRRGGWSESARAALGACRQRYLEAQNVVHSAIHALNAGNKRDYAADMRVVRKAPTDCEAAFKSRGGASGNAAAADESPLRKVNEDAVKLTTMSMLIVQAL